jgi:protein-glucosylgalactosylhydroxylysine glucosidase
LIGVVQTPACRRPVSIAGVFFAGAMLQALLFGFAGLDFDATNGIFQTVECLPDSWKSLTITGIGPQKKHFL